MYVNQVKLYLGKDVTKQNAKTYDSNRRVKIPEYLLALIKKNQSGEYIVKDTAQKIYREFKKLAIQNGYDLTFHSLRHIFASVGAYIGIQPLYLASFGGWSDQKTLTQTYEEIIDSERDKAENLLCNHFNDLLITNKSTNKSS